MNLIPELLKVVAAHGGNWDDKSVIRKGHELWERMGTNEKPSVYTANYVVDRDKFFNTQAEVKRYIHASDAAIRKVFNQGLSGVVNGHSIALNTRKLKV